MKKYKYYILAAVFAVILTLLQIFISRYMIEKDKGYIYVTTKDISKGEHVDKEDIKEVLIFGFASDFVYDGNKVCINDIPKGSILTNEIFAKMQDDSNLSLICMPVDKGRYPAGIIASSDKIDLFIIPDFKSIKINESVWLDNMLKKLHIDYDMDNDIGFMIEGLVIASLSNPESTNQYITLKVSQPIDQLLAFIKNRCTVEIILPLRY